MNSFSVVAARSSGCVIHMWHRPRWSITGYKALLLDHEREPAPLFIAHTTYIILLPLIKYDNMYTCIRCISPHQQHHHHRQGTAKARAYQLTRLHASVSDVVVGRSWKSGTCQTRRRNRKQIINLDFSFENYIQHYHYALLQLVWILYPFIHLIVVMHMHGLRSTQFGSIRMDANDRGEMWRKKIVNIMSDEKKT